MTFLQYFAIGMGALVAVVSVGYLIARANNATYFSPARQAKRSAKRALREAQIFNQRGKL